MASMMASDSDVMTRMASRRDNARLSVHHPKVSQHLDEIPFQDSGLPPAKRPDEISRQASGEAKSLFYRQKPPLSLHHALELKA